MPFSVILRSAPSIRTVCVPSSTVPVIESFASFSDPLSRNDALSSSRLPRTVLRSTVFERDHHSFFQTSNDWTRNFLHASLLRIHRRVALAPTSHRWYVDHRTTYRWPKSPRTEYVFLVLNFQSVCAQLAGIPWKSLVNFRLILSCIKELIVGNPC